MNYELDPKVIKTLSMDDEEVLKEFEKKRTDAECLLNEFLCAYYHKKYTDLAYDIILNRDNFTKQMNNSMERAAPWMKELGEWDIEPKMSTQYYDSPALLNLRLRIVFVNSAHHIVNVRGGHVVKNDGVQERLDMIELLFYPRRMVVEVLKCRWYFDMTNKATAGVPLDKMGDDWKASDYISFMGDGKMKMNRDNIATLPFHRSADCYQSVFAWILDFMDEYYLVKCNNIHLDKLGKSEEEG